jgi:uncharacterized protein YxjI
VFDTTKYIIERKLAALRITYNVKDVKGNLLGYVKAKRANVGYVKFCFEDNHGIYLGEIDGKVITVHHEYEIKDRDGQLKARIKKEFLKLFGSEWWMEDPEGQQLAKAEGEFAGHNYQILAPDGSLIAEIHRKWVSMRDSYGIEISGQSLDPLLILSYTIAMDFVEHTGKPSILRIG